MVIEKIESFAVIDQQSPLVSKCLILMWGKPEFIPFIEKLISSEKCVRGDSFSTEVLEALIDIAHYHNQNYLESKE